MLAASALDSFNCNFQGRFLFKTEKDIARAKKMGINDLKKNNWKLLFDTYLYEDIFLGSLSGRSINTNLLDDSSIYKIKSNAEIKNRLNKSVSKLDLEKNVLKYKLALKILDMPILLEKFTKSTACPMTDTFFDLIGNEVVEAVTICSEIIKLKKSINFLKPNNYSYNSIFFLYHK